MVKYAYEKDYTLMRGLIMDFCEDTVVKNVGDQFMFGPSILVNPVTTPGATSRRVYLPRGQWFNFYTGVFLQGEKFIDADAPYDKIPLFIRAGSIIPYGPELQFTAEKPADPITLFVYAGANASFTLYEDEGVNYNYEQGLRSTITFDYNDQSKTLTIGKREGEFPGMLKNREFRIVQVTPEKPVPFDPDRKPSQIVKYNGSEKPVRLK